LRHAYKKRGLFQRARRLSVCGTTRRRLGPGQTSPYTPPRRAQDARPHHRVDISDVREAQHCWKKNLRRSCAMYSPPFRITCGRETRPRGKFSHRYYSPVAEDQRHLPSFTSAGPERGSARSSRGPPRLESGLAQMRSGACDLVPERSTAFSCRTALCLVRDIVVFPRDPERGRPSSTAWSSTWTDAQARRVSPPRE